jgi:tetraacyldisaccharide 4'-kinase
MLERIWYGNRLFALPLLPLSALFGSASALRRLFYRLRLKRVHHFDVPVVVVGNLTVGGTGKTPLVIWLSRHLAARGFRPGIVSRGYGGSARHWPQQVRADSDPVVVGDEAVLLAQRTGCPMCVSPHRSQAVETLLRHTDCDIVISDDGLQHLAMGRDLEILVVDGQRGLGNGFLLPAGPLRELPVRLRRADLAISSGRRWNDLPVMKVVNPRLVPLLPSVGVAPRPLAELGGNGFMGWPASATPGVSLIC